MNRRTLLTALGFGWITGCIGTQTPADSTGSRSGTNDPGQPGSDGERTGEPHAKFSVGDRSAVAFPDANKPVSYRILNEGNPRSIHFVAVSDGNPQVNETVTLPAETHLEITFQQPADYELQVGVDGDDPVTVDRISTAEFSCVRTIGTARIGAQTGIESQIETRESDCLAPSVADTSFKTDAGECGTAHTAAVSFADGTVRVSGRVRAPQPCYQLMLDSATYDTTEKTLIVTIAVGDRTEGVCVDCLGEIPYQAVIELQHDYPQTVLIQHRESTGQLVDVSRNSR